MNRKNIIQANESFWNVFSKKKKKKSHHHFCSDGNSQQDTYLSAWLTVQDWTCSFSASQTWAILITQGWTCERLMCWCKAEKKKPQRNKASKIIYIFYRSPQNIFNQIFAQLCSALWSILSFEDFKTKALTLPSKKSFKTLRLCMHTISRCKNIHYSWIYNNFSFFKILWRNKRKHL